MGNKFENYREEEVSQKYEKSYLKIVNQNLHQMIYEKNLISKTNIEEKQLFLIKTANNYKYCLIVEVYQNLDF